MPKLVMSNLLPVNTYILNVHQLSIMAAIKHRIEVAESQQNLPLLELLELEKKTIAPLSIRFNVPTKHSDRLKSLLAWFELLTHNFKDFLADKVVPKTELQVKRLFDEAGNEWWYAYDPKSGKSVYVDSDLEMCRWIDSEYDR